MGVIQSIYFARGFYGNVSPIGWSMVTKVKLSGQLQKLLPASYLDEKLKNIGPNNLSDAKFTTKANLYPENEDS